jgi:branched-subunit amino acid transport protein
MTPAAIPPANPLGGDLAALLVIIAVALIAHEPWRWLGAYLGRSLSPEDEIFRWVKAVSTALIAGLVMRLVIFPIGAMAATPLSARLAALIVGVLCFYLARRNLLVGILAGCATIGLVSVLASSPV